MAGRIPGVEERVFVLSGILDHVEGEVQDGRGGV